MQEVEIRRIKVPGQSRFKKVYETPSQQKKGGHCGSHPSSQKWALSLK
jgi:hypothetical protein